MSYRSRFGRVHYSFITYNDSNLKWCYSAEKLEKELNEKCCGQSVTNIYASLDGYLETMHWSENFYDFSYMGGAILVFFEKTVLVLGKFSPFLCLDYQCPRASVNQGSLLQMKKT